MVVSEVLSVDSVLLRGYVTWGGILLIKMLLMAFLTAMQRFKSGVRIGFYLKWKIYWKSNFKAVENPEDVIREGTEIKKDENVERVRRAHLNDLENIPAFLFAAFFYILSEPNEQVALWLMRVAVIARIVHTIVSNNINLQYLSDL